MVTSSLYRRTCPCLLNRAKRGSGLSKKQTEAFLAHSKAESVTKASARILSSDEERAIKMHQQAQQQRTVIEQNPTLTTEQRNDQCKLSTPSYAFFAAKGYRTFHLRYCKKLTGVSSLRGFAQYEDAVRVGYRPCKFCKPDPKYDVTVSLPIYSMQREAESVTILEELSSQYGYRYWEDSGNHYIETSVGIWKVNADVSPYRIEHISLAKTPNNRTQFHLQPRMFLSLRDIVYYIKRHDEALSLTWMENQYIPAEPAEQEESL